MPFNISEPSNPCPVCKSSANVMRTSKVGVNCPRCGDFHISTQTEDDVGPQFNETKFQALASHTIRKLYASAKQRVGLSGDFFEALKTRTLPTPAEAADNLILWIAEQADGRPGRQITIDYGDTALLAILGVIGEEDIPWLTRSLQDRNLLTDDDGVNAYTGHLTAQGWQTLEELKRAHVSSNFAFFARKFKNSELDQVFNDCLCQAVKDTGYELRTATQRAGLVDAVIEDEIRRCRFLIADLSDSNAGAYWEAGFAEGLGKPVIYICKAGCEVHFDTDHRHTVRWDLNNLAHTAKQLKAVIRNTLLGDAKQSG
jgi:hypothetical protein